MEAAALGLKVTGVDSIDRASTSLNKLAQSGKTAESAASSLNSSSRNSTKVLADVSRESDRASRSMSALASAIRPVAAGLAAAFSIRSLSQYADSWSDMTSLVRVNIGAHEDAAEVMERLADIARSTYSSLELTAQGFAQNAFTLSALGKTTQQQLDYTAALNNALVVSGAKGQQAQMVQDSLNRAMAEGSLRGQELQNVLNYGSTIASLLAEELGVNVTQLREVAKEGRITADVIYNALVKNMEMLEETAGTMPATIGDAFLLMRNSILQAVGVYDQANGISEEFAERLVKIADAIRETDWGPYIDGLGTAAKVIGAYLIAVNAVPVGMALATAATKAYSTVTGAAAAAEASSLSAKLSSIAATRKQALATAQASAAELEFLRTVQASLVAQLKSATSSEAMSAIRAQLAANTRALVAAQNAYTASTNAASVATTAKAGAVALLTTGMSNLLQVAAAFYTGWQIGTYLREQFEIVEKAGIALMGGLHTTTIRVAGFFKIMGENIKFAVTNPLDAARGAVADLLEWLAGLGRDVLRFLGFDGLADRIQTEFAGIRGATAAEHKATLEQIRADTAAEVEFVNGIYADMFASVGSGAAKAASATKEVVEATKNLATATGGVTDKQEELQKAFDQTLAMYHRQKNLAEDATEVDKLLYEIQHGRLKGLQKDHETTLRNLAEEIDKRKQLAEINRERDTISRELMTEEEKILESYARRRAIIENATFENEQARTELLLRLEKERNEALIEATGSYWDRWLLAAEENLSSFDELSKTVIDSFTQQFSNAFADMILEAETLGDAVRGMAQGMVRAIVGAIGEMIAQWLAYQAVQLATGKATRASAAAAMISQATAMQQMAALNAFASTAAIPVVGPAAAQAAAMAATAATSPYVAAVTSASLAGMAHDGIDSVPKTGTWLLEKGERVTTAETSAKLDRTLNSVQRHLEGNAPNGPGEWKVEIINNTGAQVTAQRVQTDRGQILQVLIDDINENGPLSRTIQSNFGVAYAGR